ncbi:MAG: hypothetical protein E7602_04455 [Ruminococcaceae bacterium]|nr:hypothetical protein [Oscillospiraceae bacterium]
MNFQNAIRVNQRGFLKSSQKRFVLTENKSGCETFDIYLIENVEERKVFTGKLQEHNEDGKRYFVGDFSSITSDGDYFIEAGGFRSRQFVIYDGAYDICQRVMLEYFKYQRCGHPLGWNGACHLDDGFIKETGERVDLSGGYHQSCDLRKSPGGVSIGVVGLLRFALKDKSEWGKILLTDEAKWALEYYIKVIGENGAMYNTLSSPFGWDGREFYKSPAPSSAQWNVTSCLALGYLYFKDNDFSFAKKCLEKAILSYDFLMGKERPSGVYKHPEKYPFGMDPDSFYEQCERDSTSDIAYQITVSHDLYRATGEKKYLDLIKLQTPKILELVDGFALIRGEANGKLVTASCSYSWLMGGLLCLYDAYELLGDFCNLKSKISSVLDSICEFLDKSVWQTPDLIYSDSDLDIIDGHEGKTRRESMGELLKFGNYYYQKNSCFHPSYGAYIGLFLAKGAKALSDSKYMGYAQSILDNLLGANDLDSSRIRGVGYNNCQHHSYGQFFPSTPFIPGAVGVGYHSVDTYNSSSEYDMPCVGISLYLISEICN